MMRRPPFTRRVLTGGHRSLRWTCGHGPDRDGCAGRVRRDHAAAPVRRHARHGASPREAPRRGVRFPPAGREGAWQAGGMTAAGMTFDERYRVIQSRDRRFDGQFVTAVRTRSEEHTYELPSLMRIPSAVF